MLSESWQPNNVAAWLAAPGLSGLSASAQASADGSRLVIRVVNSNAAPVAVALIVSAPFSGGSMMCTTTTLSAASLDAANPPGDPTRVSPVHGAAVKLVMGKGTLQAPGFSITNVEC